MAKRADSRLESGCTPRFGQEIGFRLKHDKRVVEYLTNNHRGKEKNSSDSGYNSSKAICGAAEGIYQRVRHRDEGKALPAWRRRVQKAYVIYTRVPWAQRGVPRIAWRDELYLLL
jgi:hypothetical protein